MSNTQTYFFENKGGNTITINGARFGAMLRDFMFLEVIENDLSHFWFQQDGATARTRLDSMTLIHRMLNQQIILKKGQFRLGVALTRFNAAGLLFVVVFEEQILHRVIAL